MEMVKTYPKLSPFQQALLRGLHEGVLVEGEIERIKAEGADLTLKTAERFFRASAREESYRYATRLLDILLSYYLTSYSSDAVLELKEGSLSHIVRKGVTEIRQLSQLPTTSLLPRQKGDSELIELLVEKAEKIRFSTHDALVALGTEVSQRRLNEELITLGEFFIVRVGGNIQDFDNELSDDVCHADLLATIYNLAVGPYLTRAVLRQIARRKRPTLDEVKSKLQLHQATIPLELQAKYGGLVDGFLNLSTTKAFFGKKASISVFTNPRGGMYYAERSADAFDS